MGEWMLEVSMAHLDDRFLMALSVLLPHVLSKLGKTMKSNKSTLLQSKCSVFLHEKQGHGLSSELI
jgi:hypothetical protein